LRDEVVEIAESEIDALGGLKILRVLEEFGAEVPLDGLDVFGMLWAEGQFGGSGGQAALFVVGEAVLAAGFGSADVDGWAWVSAHDGPQLFGFGSAGRGNPDGYQKKGVAGETKRIVVKRRELANVGFDGAGNWESVLERRAEAGLRLSHDTVARKRVAVNTYMLQY
jgi:hypothetical protein